MEEVEATIPQNSEQALSETPEPQETPAPSEPPAVSAEPKRRGRPAGSKDRAPRTKLRVKVEPIPQPEPTAPAPLVDLPDRSTPPERPPSPEPPSPRTLFRQTSAHLLNLRDVMNSQKRASAADRYTSRLHAWPV